MHGPCIACRSSIASSLQNRYVCSAPAHAGAPAELRGKDGPPPREGEGVRRWRGDGGEEGGRGGGRALLAEGEEAERNLLDGSAGLCKLSRGERVGAARELVLRVLREHLAAGWGVARVRQTPPSSLSRPLAPPGTKSSLSLSPRSSRHQVFPLPLSSLLQAPSRAATARQASSRRAPSRSRAPRGAASTCG